MFEREEVVLEGGAQTGGMLIRDFHDATAGTPLADGGEVVCHGDLGSHNIVFDGEWAAGLIDWDEEVGPGRRLVDLAHAVWCCRIIVQVMRPGLLT